MRYNEIKCDLFSLGPEYYLAHCISADFALGAGIAVQFNRRFDLHKKLKAEYPRYANYWNGGTLPGMDKCCKCIETIERAEDVKDLDSLIEACSVLGKVTVALDQIDYNYSEESQVICNFAPGVIQALSVLQDVYVDSNDYEVLSESVGVIEIIMQLLGKVKHQSKNR